MRGAEGTGAEGKVVRGPDCREARVAGKVRRGLSGADATSYLAQWAAAFADTSLYLHQGPLAVTHPWDCIALELINM